MPASQVQRVLNIYDPCTGDLSVAEKFLDDSERLYGEPHPTRFCVRSARRIVVKVSPVYVRSQIKKKSTLSLIHIAFTGIQCLDGPFPLRVALLLPSVLAQERLHSS